MNSFVPRSIAYNHPGFQSLPSGIKSLLLVSETYFFNELSSRPNPPRRPPTAARAFAVESPPLNAQWISRAR
jgi:hypothetical protein